MAKFALFFEVNGIAEDGDGNPCPAAMKAVFDSCIPADTDYWTIAQAVDLDKLAAFFPLGNITARDIRILSQGEYAEEYGEEEQGEWIAYGDQPFDKRYTCSRCGCTERVKEVMGEPAWDFCPNCGRCMKRRNA